MTLLSATILSAAGDGDVVAQMVIMLFLLLVGILISMVVAVDKE